MNESVMGRVFAIYAVFWLVVIVGLLFGIGLLLKQHDRAVEKRKHGGH